ncbi:hypothetical protein Salat_2894500 [Sesamum alatum]|uniref:Transposase MuDR plant domain-containing protein n=1 Tax=Sesamum alatum TaxID=300844 RepID=A0AAE2C811_9LAMI|nr:hypothetical protein Salat_2894500 [Sesamum alatum]
MAREICHENWMRFYYNLNGPDDCKNLVLIVSDDDARNLIRFVDSERVVGIYIDTSEPEPDHFLEIQVESNPTLSKMQFEDVVNEDQEDQLDKEYENIVGLQHDQHMNDHEFEKSCQGHEVDMIEIDNITDENDSDEDIDTNDSTFSDDFQDSDFEYDDLLFDENIDREIEWVGIWDDSLALDKGKMVVLILCTEHLRPSSKNQSFVKGKISKYLIYKDDANSSNFEFEVGLCFKTATDFRDAVRKYSNKQGKPLKFTKNCSDKIHHVNVGWVIYASFISKIDKTFQVKLIKGEHSCYRAPNSKHCTSRFLAKKISTPSQE